MVLYIQRIDHRRALSDSSLVLEPETTLRRAFCGVGPPQPIRLASYKAQTGLWGLGLPPERAQSLMQGVQAW